MNDLPPTLNDIDARLYFTLLSARKTAYALVQDSTKPLARCLAELLDQRSCKAKSVRCPP